MTEPYNAKVDRGIGSLHKKNEDLKECSGIMEIDERSPIEAIDGWLRANQCEHPPADCGMCAAKSLLNRLRRDVIGLAVEATCGLAVERDRAEEAEARNSKLEGVLLEVGAQVSHASEKLCDARGVQRKDEIAIANARNILITTERLARAAFKAREGE